jgi:hypothetical protein
MATTPDPKNLYLGAGSVYFDRFDTDGKSTGLRHLGNVDTFEITTTPEVKEKKNAMDGAKATYAEVVVGNAAALSMVITEYTKENLALAMMGEESAFTQTADAAVVDQGVGPSEDDEDSVALDVWYDMGVFTPTVTAVKQGVTTLDEDAYELDAEHGMIRLLSSYTGDNKAVAGTAITWSGSVPAIAATDGLWQVQGMAVGMIKGRVRYISADNQSSGPKLVIDVWICGLTPDGALGLITDDFGSFTLKGKVYADTSKPVGQRYYRAIGY